MTVTDASPVAPPELVGGFVGVCRRARLQVNRGVAALVDGVAVAVFLLDDGTLHAIANIDPFSGASVLSRGLIGDCDGEPTVASPLYKQRFSLLTGRCLDDRDTAVAVHQARVAKDLVEIRLVGCDVRR